MSTRAVVNSTWENANSRRSSSVDGAQQNAQQGARIGQHLSRLHKKAQEQQPAIQNSDAGGRSQSVMSECNNQHPSPNLSGSFGGRRASDPVRVLDRNFGVNGQHSRHRSGSYAGHQPGQPESANNPSYQVKNSTLTFKVSTKTLKHSILFKSSWFSFKT